MPAGMTGAGGNDDMAALMGALLTWLTGGATTASSRFALAVGKWAAIAVTISLFLLTLRRSGERAGRLAERLETMEKANEIQRQMLEASARRPHNRGELACLMTFLGSCVKRSRWSAPQICRPAAAVGSLLAWS